MMHDWRPAREAKVDGMICTLRFRDGLGYYEGDGRYFLHDDGHWYRIDPPTQIKAQVTHWRPITDEDIM